MKIELSDQLFLDALPILKRIESHGYEAYFVGGCVRDTLLGQPIHDIDIATSARPEEIEAIFYHTIDIGKEHGTIIVVNHHVPYEITTFRTEGNYSDFRHPDSVDFVRDLREDTLRRDFTINALAFDAKGELYDFHNGQNDLENRIIRAVGNPMERFEEDALRMVRAIRFASQLGFKIDATTFEAIQQSSLLMRKIATERIRMELSKFFQGPYFKETYHLLYESNIATALPLFEGMNLNEAMEVMQERIPIHYFVDERIAWFLLCKGLKLKQKPMRQFLRNWTHSNQFIQDVSNLYELESIIVNGQLNNWQVYRYPIELSRILEDYLRALYPSLVSRVEAIYQQLPIKEKNEIVVNGSIMMEWLSLEKGNARLGILIKSVEKAIVLGELPNQIENIKAFVLKNY